MSIGILGKKLGMSQLFDHDGNAVPVTLIEAGPCRITQLKTQALDGYSAVQIGYGISKDKHLSKPEKGHLLKSGEELLKYLKEYRVEETSTYELGKKITVSNFFNFGQGIVLRKSQKSKLFFSNGMIFLKDINSNNVKKDNQKDRNSEWSHTSYGIRFPIERIELKTKISLPGIIKNKILLNDQ